MNSTLSTNMYSNMIGTHTITTNTSSTIDIVMVDLVTKIVANTTTIVVDIVDNATNRF